MSYSYLSLEKIRKAFKNPIGFIRISFALARGLFYIIIYRIKSNKYKLKFPLFAFCKLSIAGPGYVQIGKGCKIFKNMYEGLTIITCNHQAKVFIGNNSSLGGLTIRCGKQVIIGNSLLSANALIQDSLLFCSHDQSNNDVEIINTKSIIVGDNVWLGPSAIVLSGCRVGDDSVVLPGSLCHNVIIPNYSIAMGNPVTRLFPIERYLNLMKHS